MRQAGFAGNPVARGSGSRNCCSRVNGGETGITGWAQVNGRNLVSDEEKAFLDGEYVANMSLAFDARVFFRTISVVFSRRGVDREAR